MKNEIWIDTWKFTFFAGIVAIIGSIAVLVLVVLSFQSSKDCLTEKAITFCESRNAELGRVYADSYGFSCYQDHYAEGIYFFSYAEKKECEYGWLS